MFLSKFARCLPVVVLAAAMFPATPAQAAKNKPPKIVKAELKDTNGNGLADRIVLTYNEKIKHKVDTKKFPFRVQGYKIARVSAAKGSSKLGLVLKENPNAPARPASVKYTRTRKQPVVDLKKKQARKQLLTKNIIGLVVTPPPPPPPPPVEEFTLTTVPSGEGQGRISSNDSRIDCGSRCSATYEEGAQVTLTALPDSASDATFGGWTGCTSSTTSCTVTMDADKTVTGRFDEAGTFAMNVTKQGTGTGNVTSTSTPSQTSQINCGATCSVSFPASTLVTLKAVPTAANSSIFAGWSGGGCTGTGDTCNVLMDQVRNVVATFSLPIQNTLTVNNSSGSGSGTVTSSDGKINCGAICNAEFPKDATVTLSVTPSAGSQFAGWGGAATCPVSSTSCQVPVSTDPTTVSTVFNSTPTGTHQLNVTKSGLGAVTSTPAGIDCPQTSAQCDPAVFAAGVPVQLTAVPGPGMRVKEWTGDCSGNSLTCQVTMTGPKVVGVVFELDVTLPGFPGLQP